MRCAHLEEENLGRCEENSQGNAAVCKWENELEEVECLNLMVLREDL